MRSRFPAGRSEFRQGGKYEFGAKADSRSRPLNKVKAMPMEVISGKKTYKVSRHFETASSLSALRSSEYFLLLHLPSYTNVGMCYVSN